MSDDVTATPAIDDDIATALVDAFPGSVFVLSHGQPVVYVDRAHWHAVAEALKTVHDMTSCMDVTAVDHLTNAERVVPSGVAPERFEVVANFLSHRRNRRIRVIAQLPESDPTVASIVDLYPGTDFPEREVFDLMGIEFVGHPDLTRILMPEGWDGFPLRKDAPSARVPVTFKEDPTPR
ncbi:MAG: NADH-quinone oxidoreductase subunit C [Acidimicrobiia bacterium]